MSFLRVLLFRFSLLLSQVRLRGGQCGERCASAAFRCCSTHLSPPFLVFSSFIIAVLYDPLSPFRYFTWVNGKTTVQYVALVSLSTFFFFSAYCPSFCLVVIKIKLDGQCCLFFVAVTCTFPRHTHARILSRAFTTKIHTSRSSNKIKEINDVLLQFTMW
jgi:hypothetical protein